jgi:hypothetical protein
MHTEITNMSIPLLEQKALRMTLAGKKERYAIRKLMQLLNCNDKYIYEFFATPDDECVGYEGIIYVKNKLTEKILDLYIIEAKVRDHSVKQAELFYEQKKHNTLKKVKANLIKQGTSFDPKIIYINFCYDGTHMFFIDDIIFAGLMPKMQRIPMNKVTVMSTEKKVTKGVYLLNKDLAVSKDFIFNPVEYANHLLTEATEATKEAQTIIKTYHSIF